MMFVVVEGQDSTCPRLDPRLQFIAKAYDIPCSIPNRFAFANAVMLQIPHWYLLFQIQQWKHHSKF